MFKDDAVMKYMCFGMAALPELVAMIVGVCFAIWSPDRLQSEEFVIRQKELTMIEKKGGQVLPPDHVDVEPITPSLSD